MGRWHFFLSSETVQGALSNEPVCSLQPGRAEETSVGKGLFLVSCFMDSFIHVLACLWLIHIRRRIKGPFVGEEGMEDLKVFSIWYRRDLGLPRHRGETMSRDMNYAEPNLIYSSTNNIICCSLKLHLLQTVNEGV